MYSQGIAHDGKGVKVSFETLLRLFNFTPQNTNHITQHTHISSSSLAGTGLSFLLLGNNNKADAIYQVQAEKHHLFLMVTLTGAFPLCMQSKVTHSRHTPL